MSGARGCLNYAWGRHRQNKAEAPACLCFLFLFLGRRLLPADSQKDRQAIAFLPAPSRVHGARQPLKEKHTIGLSSGMVDGESVHSLCECLNLPPFLLSISSCG